MKKIYTFTLMLAISFLTFTGYAQDLTEDFKTSPAPFYTAKDAEFGQSVSIDGDYAVVGSPEANNETGEVYVLYNNGTSWEKIATLSPSTIQNGSYFGRSVSIKGDIIVVGATDYKGATYTSGAVFVFVKPTEGWSDIHETAILKASYGTDSYSFGFAVDISRDGNTIVVGEYYYEYQKLYIFEKPGDDWINMTQTAKAYPVGTTKFALSVSVSANGAVIVSGDEGRDDDGLSNNGAVFVFVRDGDTWNTGADIHETAVLLASDKASNDKLGTSVDISDDGNVIVGGAQNKDNGAVYIFEKPDGGWVNNTEVKKVVASDGATYDYFGNAVDISGNIIAIGAKGDDDGGIYNTGSVYIFEKTASEEWADITQKARFDASDRIGNMLYSEGGVALSGDIVIVGTPSTDNSQGAVYFHKKADTGWSDGTEYYKAPAIPYLSENHMYASYGYSVDISGDYGVIGAYKDNEQYGNIYVIHNTGTSWETVAVLTSSDVKYNSYFGKTVAIYGDVIVAGGLGTLYIFEKPESGWEDATETHKLTGTGGRTDIDIYGNTLICENGSNLDVFTNTDGGSWIDVTTKTVIPIGSTVKSVSISDNGSVIAAGISYYNSYEGGVYVVEKGVDDDWATATKTLLTASDGKANDYLGFSVKVTNDILVAGAYRNDDNGYYAGKAYVFVRPQDGWSSVDFKQKLYPGDPLTSDNFGSSVDIYENRIVIGASGRGRAYIFDREVDDSWETDAITQTYKLASGWSTEAYFGISVAIDYSTSASEFIVLIGESDNSETQTRAGATYIYHITDQVTLINEREEDRGLAVYPNPVNSVLNLTNDQIAKSVTILTLTGQKIMEELNVSANGRINLSDLKQGVYFVKIKIGNKVITRKVIKR